MSMKHYAISNTCKTLAHTSVITYTLNENDKSNILRKKRKATVVCSALRVIDLCK